MTISQCVPEDVAMQISFEGVRIYFLRTKICFTSSLCILETAIYAFFIVISTVTVRFSRTVGLNFELDGEFVLSTETNVSSSEMASYIYNVPVYAESNLPDGPLVFNITPHASKDSAFYLFDYAIYTCVITRSHWYQ